MRALCAFGKIIQKSLSILISLFSGTLHPNKSFLHILLDTFSFCIHGSHIILGLRIILFCSQGKPLESFLVIPGNPYPIPIHPSKVILGICTT